MAFKITRGNSDFDPNEELRKAAADVAAGKRGGTSGGGNSGGFRITRGENAGGGTSVTPTQPQTLWGTATNNPTVRNALNEGRRINALPTANARINAWKDLDRKTMPIRQAQAEAQRQAVLRRTFGDLGTEFGADIGRMDQAAEAWNAAQAFQWQIPNIGANASGQIGALSTVTATNKELTRSFAEEQYSKLTTEAEELQNAANAAAMMQGMTDEQMAEADTRQAEANAKRREATQVLIDAGLNPNDYEGPVKLLRDFGIGVGGAVSNFVSGVGQGTIGTFARLMEMPDDLLYQITGDEQFNLDRTPGLRDSEALRQSDQFARIAQEASDRSGPIMREIIKAGGAAGNMMGSAALWGQAFGSFGQTGTMGRLAEIAGNDTLAYSNMAKHGAQIGLEILSNPGNFGVSLGSAVNGYSEAMRSGASFDQALTNGVYKGLTEYFSNKLFSGMPFEDTADKGYVTKLIEAVADKMGKSEALQRFVESSGGQALGWFTDKVGEGLEEVVTGLLDPAIDWATLDADYEIDSLAEEFVGGVVLSLLMGGGEALVNNVNTARTGRDYNLDEDTVRALLGEGLAAEEGSRSRALAEQYSAMLDGGQSLSNWQVGRQVRANEADIAAGRISDDPLVRAAEEMAAERAEAERAAEGVGPYEADAAEATPHQSPEATASTRGEASARENAGGLWAAPAEVDAAEDAQDAQLRQAAENGGMGQHGVETIADFLFGPVDTADYYGGFAAYYNAGRAGTDINGVQTQYAGALNETAKRAAWNAGRMDAIEAESTGNRAETKDEGPLSSASQTPSPEGKAALSVSEADSSPGGGAKGTAQTQQSGYTYSVEQRGDGYTVRVQNAETGENHTVGSFADAATAAEVAGSYAQSTGGTALASDGSVVYDGRNQTGTAQVYPSSVAQSATPSPQGEGIGRKENGNGRESVLSRSGERNDGQSAGEQAEKLEKGTGRDQGRDEGRKGAAARSADGEASRLTHGEAVSTASLGVAKGSASDRIYLVTGGETAATKAAKALAKKHGLRLVLFTGGNLHVDGVGEARGYISGDRVFVRADHPYFTADQIMRHEVGHQMIRDGEIDQDSVRDRIADLYGEDGVQTVAELYASAYAGMTAEEAWEEIICDSLGDMNVFSGVLDTVAKPYQQYLEAVRAATENSARSERGPPSADTGASPQMAEELTGRTSRETDPDTLEFLDDQKHVKVYRAMQVIDGKLYPPMAAKVKGDDGKTNLVEPTEIGAWYRSDERPDLVKNGKFTLNKGNGSSIAAAYNPYFHSSASPLNDQFSSAWNRPNLVVVEGEIPSSELTSGYRADGAKNAVGETQWHSGPVAGKLKGEKARRVYLSRWFKVNRIVPDAEVARIVAKTLQGEDVAVPTNVVTPSLLAELRKNGVKIEEVQGKGGASTTEKLSREIEQRDADYLAAVERGDTETAQRMVDEAAEAAGYDSPKLYHGTRGFGFTRFDTTRSDDGISLFATSSPRTAETYSGVTTRNRIKDRATVNVDDLHGEELLKEVKKQPRLARYNDYRLMSEDEREVVRSDARQSILAAKTDAQQFIADHDGAFDAEKTAIMNRLTNALTRLASSGDEDAVQRAWDDWQEAVWDFKDIDDALAIEFLDAIGSKQLFFAKNHLNDVMYAGDMYFTGDDYSYSYVFDNQLALELDAELHKGIYELYGRSGRQLVIDADGANWNQINAPDELNLYGPQRTRDIAAAAKANGYNSVLFRNLRDNGGETAYNGTSDVYIFFNANDLKSADPVTYDDEGNVIPLSERFNPADEDIRFSSELPGLEELRRQNEALRGRVDYWKGQTKRTTQPTLRKGDVDKMARSLVKDYASTADAGEIGAELKRLGEYILRNGEGNDELTFSAVKERAVGIAQTLVENAEELAEKDGDLRHDLRGVLQQPMVISARDAHDVAPEWGPWRNANRGKVNVSINGQGTPVDTVYAELSEDYPSLFPADVLHPADQLQRMVDVMDELEPVYVNPFSYNMAEAVEYAANDIIDALLGEDVRQTPPTIADRAEARLQAEKARGAARVAEVREQKNAQIADLRQRNAWATAQAVARERRARDEKIAKLRQHYKDVAEAKRAWKADSEARTKLLKVARRLQRIKTTAASRALIDELIGDLDTVSKSLTTESVEKLVKLREWYMDRKANDPDFISDPATEEKLERLSRRQIADLDLNEVRELTEALLNIEHELRTSKKLIDSEDRREVFAQGLDVIADVRATKGSKAGGIAGAVDKLILTETLSPVRQVKRMVGWADSDPLLRLTNELADGQRRMFDFQRRANKRFLSFTEDRGFVKQIAGKNAKEIKITGISPGRGPVTVSITPAMRMSLYLHSLNDQNLKHIAGGGMTVPDMKLYKQGKLADAYAYGTKITLTPSEVRRIADGMTDKERAFARAASAYFNGMSQEEINAVSEKLKGYSLAKVQNYFPINTDTSFTQKDFESLKFDGTIEGMGFLKERINSASPIMLRDMNTVLEQSINNTAKYVGLAIPVRNFNKVWGVTKASFNEDGSRNGYESSVQQAVKQTWGPQAAEYIEKMMTDLQNGGRNPERWDKVMNRIRSNYAGAVLTLNLSVAMKQAASYPTAAAVIGFKPLARAMADLGKVDLDLIEKYTPLQWYRTKGFSTQELGDMSQRGMQLPKALNWVQFTDLLTTRKLWKAAEYYIRDTQKGLAVGTDAYYKAVAEVYDRIIEETQPNYTTMQRPQLLRSDSTLVQNLAMFKTQPFQNFNILYDAYGNLAAKRRAYLSASNDTARATAKAAYQEAQKQARWATASQLVQLAVFAGMTALWNLFRGKLDKYKDDDKDEVTAGSFAEGIGKDMISGAFSMVPFGSDVYELASALILGEKYYGMDAVAPSALSDFFTQIKSAGDAVKGLFDQITDPEKSVNWNDQRLKWDKVAKSASKVLGVPFENVENLFNAAFQWAARGVGGEYQGEYAYLRLTTNPSSNSGAYYDLLYSAMNNDAAAYRDIYKAMIDSGDFDSEKIRNAMEKRMKDAAGVTSVKDLEERYRSPEEADALAKIAGDLSGNRVWNRATEAQRDAAAEKLYQVQTGKDEKGQAAVEGGKRYGLSETEYGLYLLALSVVDQPNKSGKLGSYTSDEYEEAIGMVPGLSDRERSYLWSLSHTSDKNNPWA